MLVKVTCILQKNDDFDPYMDPFDVDVETILQKKGKGKWKETVSVMHLDKVITCQPHEFNPQWTVVLLDGGIDIIVKENIQDLVKVWEIAQSAAPFKKLHYIGQN